MENNKKEHLTEDLPLHNSTNLVLELDTEVKDEKEKDEEEKEKKVNFHSDFINEKVGDLDITV